MKELIRKPVLTDAEAFFAFEKENGESIREYFMLPEFSSVSETVALLQKYEEQRDREFYWVCSKDGEIAGAVTLTQIRREPFQSANLNFYLGLRFRGQGMMTTSLLQVLDVAFNELGLNRIEAFIHPENRKSREVVRRAGFRYEGMMRQYFRIQGIWCDHQRWAVVASDHESRSKAEPVGAGNEDHPGDS